LQPKQSVVKRKGGKKVNFVFYINIYNCCVKLFYTIFLTYTDEHEVLPYNTRPFLTQSIGRRQMCACVCKRGWGVGKAPSPLHLKYIWANLKLFENSICQF